VRSSNSEDGAVDDASREKVAVALSVTWGHLAFVCREPWWRKQHGDQPKSLG